MKVLAFDARRELTAQNSGAQYVGLMRITPVGGGDVIRLCTTPMERFSVDPLRYGMTSRGERYDFMGVRFVLPDSRSDALPATTMAMDNIDPAIVEATRTSVYRASLDFEVVLSTRPDDPIESYPGMEIAEASWNEDEVTLVIGYETLATTPLVRHRISASVFPATRLSV